MKILILDHHPLVCEMITMIIHRIQPKAKVVVTHTLRQLDGCIDKHKDANFVIIEPQSTGCIGPMSVAHIAQRLPHVPVIVLTDSELDPSDNIYLEQGAHLFVSKQAKVKELTDTLRGTLTPKTAQDDASPRQVVVLKISKRHRQLINMLAQGHSNQQIALQLDISEHTVKVHFSRLYKILGVNSRLQALNFAKTNGWIIDSTAP